MSIKPLFADPNLLHLEPDYRAQKITSNVAFPMGHHIQVFISREELLREITQHCPTAIVIPLSQGFGMLPVTKQVYDGLPNPQHPDEADNRFLYLGPKLLQIGKAISVKAPLAYVETEYCN